jgi:predicted flap endonuclease-1-like 5' DNA nuclease
MTQAYESRERTGTPSNFPWPETPFAAPFAAAAAWNAAMAVSYGTWMGYWQAVVEGARSQAPQALMEGAFAPNEGSAATANDSDLLEAEAPVEEAPVVVEEEALPDAPESLESVANPPRDISQTEEPAEPVLAEAPVEAKAVGTKPPGLDAPRNGSADDLKLISGIGNKTEKTLHELGIWHYDQLARWTNDEAAWIDDYFKFKGRVFREKWIAQADALAAGGVEEYARRFGKEPKHKDPHAPR